jgi:hypothetical protein
MADSPDYAYFYGRIRIALSDLRGSQNDFEHALEDETDYMRDDVRRLATKQRDALLRDGTCSRG